MKYPSPCRGEIISLFLSRFLTQFTFRQSHRYRNLLLNLDRVIYDPAKAARINHVDAMHCSSIMEDLKGGSLRKNARGVKYSF